jgi:hypothetical protein
VLVLDGLDVVGDFAGHLGRGVLLEEGAEILLFFFIVWGIPEKDCY